MHPYPRYRHMLWLPKTLSISGKCDYSVDKEGVDRRPGTFWIRDILIKLALQSLPCPRLPLIVCCRKPTLYLQFMLLARILVHRSSMGEVQNCFESPADVCQFWEKCQTATSENRRLWSFFLGFQLSLELFHPGVRSCG
jgi:hypothetical protein